MDKGMVSTADEAPRDVLTSDDMNFLLSAGCRTLVDVRREGVDPFPGCSDSLLVLEVTEDIARAEYWPDGYNGDRNPDGSLPRMFYIVGESMRDIALTRAIARRKITPRPTDLTHTACSYGKSAADGKWYGWSHRAIIGFGIGDMQFDPGCLDPNSPSYIEGCNDTPFVHLGHVKIETDAQAQIAASRFAEWIS